MNSGTFCNNGQVTCDTNGSWSSPTLGVTDGTPNAFIEISVCEGKDPDVDKYDDCGHCP